MRNVKEVFLTVPLVVKLYSIVFTASQRKPFNAFSSYLNFIHPLISALRRAQKLFTSLKTTKVL